MSKIEIIKARQILDSRGNPTVEVDVTLSSGAFGRAAVPSGASTGSREALEKRDGDKNVYLGKGVLSAINSIEIVILPSLKGMCALNQKEIDDKLIALDGTADKSNLGANALLGVSLAVAKAAANYQKIPFNDYIAKLYSGDVSKQVLPTPMMNVINGGEHAENKLDIQEFMIMPVGASSFSEALQMGAEIFHHLKKVLSSKGLNTAVGDEGGFAPNFNSNEEALQVLSEAVKNASYVAGKDVFFAIDAAASEFCENKNGEFFYNLKGEGRILTSEELVDYYEQISSSYPIISIEDGMDEADREGWKLLNSRLGSKLQIVGDDLFVTNAKILKEGIEQKLANSILIKVNQIGTLSETLETMKLAEENGFSNVVSHRSGETEDTTIADLAVGTSCGQIKTGSLSRSDRIAKYNQLLRISEQIGDDNFAGKKTIINFCK